MTLREIFTNAEWLARELTEHLEQSFRPKCRSLEDIVRPNLKVEEREAVADSTIRSGAAALCASDDYSQMLLQKLDRCLNAIQERSQLALTAK